MAENPSANRNKPRLGRGLSSLIVNSAPKTISVPKLSEKAQAGEGTPTQIPVEQISPNPHQPRREFNDEHIAELAESIKEQGVLQPLLVAPATNAEGTQYVLIAGERRWRASKSIGLPTVPCIIRQASPQQMVEWAMIENIQREDLNAVELAQAYREFMDRFGLTQVQVAQRVGQSRAAVANTLRVLELPDEVQGMLVAGALSFGHAKVLAGLAGHANRQASLAKRVVRDNLSVRQLEGIIATGDIQTGKADGRKGGVKKEQPAYVRDLQDQLTQQLGTKVTIKTGKATSSGKLVIDYYTLDDFDRILGALGVSLEG
jgi:ParB family chromosome partitioning protein